MAHLMKTKCWKCGGKGWIVNHVLGVGTFGLGYLLQHVAGKPSCDDDCPICDGKGWLDDDYEDDDYEDDDYEDDD